MTKASGAEIWRFFEHGFPEYHYVDDYSMDAYDDNGKCALNPVEKYDLRDFGWCYLEYNPNGKFKDNYNGNSVEYFFKKWKKAQDCVILSVTIPKGKEAELKDFVKAMGGSVE